MLRPFVLLVVVLTLLPATAYACSCAWWPAWSQGVADIRGVIARVKVESQSGSGFDERTTVRILRVFHGTLDESKLTIVSRTSCDDGVGKAAVGKEFVWHLGVSRGLAEARLPHCGLSSLSVVDGRIRISAEESGGKELLLSNKGFAAWLARQKPRDSTTPVR